MIRREKKIKADLPETILCEHCGKTIFPGRWRRRRFCTNACKQAAYRARLVTVTQERNDDARI